MKCFFFHLLHFSNILTYSLILLLFFGCAHFQPNERAKDFGCASSQAFGGFEPCAKGQCFDLFHIDTDQIVSGCAFSAVLCNASGCTISADRRKFVCCCAHSFCNGKSSALIRARWTMYQKGAYPLALERGGRWRKSAKNLANEKGQKDEKMAINTSSTETLKMTTTTNKPKTTKLSNALGKTKEMSGKADKEQRINEDEKRSEEEKKINEDERRKVEEERRMNEKKRKAEEEKRMNEHEKKRKEEEKRMNENEKRRKAEEEKRMNEKVLKAEEQSRMNENEKRKVEEEKRMNEHEKKRKAEEEKRMNENEKRRKVEEEKRMNEKRKDEEEKRTNENEKRRKAEEEKRMNEQKVEEEKRANEAEKRRKAEDEKRINDKGLKSEEEKRINGEIRSVASSNASFSPLITYITTISSLFDSLSTSSIKPPFETTSFFSSINNSSANSSFTVSSTPSLPLLSTHSQLSQPQRQILRNFSSSHSSGTRQSDRTTRSPKTTAGITPSIDQRQRKVQRTNDAIPTFPWYWVALAGFVCSSAVFILIYLTVRGCRRIFRKRSGNVSERLTGHEAKADGEVPIMMANGKTEGQDRKRRVTKKEGKRAVGVGLTVKGKTTTNDSLMSHCTTSTAITTTTNGEKNGERQEFEEGEQMTVLDPLLNKQWSGTLYKN